MTLIWPGLRQKLNPQKCLLIFMHLDLHLYDARLTNIFENNSVFQKLWQILKIR